MHDNKTIDELLHDRHGQAIGTAEVCHLFNLSRETLHQMTKAARIPHYRVANRLRFDPIELSRWWAAAKIG